MSHPQVGTVTSDDQCRLITIQDNLQPCPYVAGETARMPLQLPVGVVTSEVTDDLLAAGFRRSGDFVYRTQCPSCIACEPTRLEVERFAWTKSFRRVLNRGDRDLEARWGPPRVDSPRIELFAKHRLTRGLSHGDDEVTADSYRGFLIESCGDTLEWSTYHDGGLVGVSIMDVGAESVSAVYTFFDPDYSRYSPGTYAVLSQIRWAAAHGRRYVYLGMYVASNRHLNYKARFGPQQRFIDGHWIDIDEAILREPRK